MSTPAAAGAVLGVLCVVPAALLALSSGGQADETAAPGGHGLGFALTTPAVLFGVVAALLLLVAAVQRPPRRLPRWRRRPLVALLAVAALPRYWTVELASPGLFGGLAGEMMAMPCVVAVQHLP
jgi:hypothetical protein